MVGSIQRRCHQQESHILQPRPSAEGYAAEVGHARNLAVLGYANYVLQLCTVAIGLDGSARERYFGWLTERILNQIAQSEPEIHAWLLSQIKELVVNGVANGMKG